MIYNEEYSRKIREGHNVPREKWCTYKPSISQPADDWISKLPTQKIKLTFGKCVVCGSGIFWRAESKPRTICLMCETWAEGYSKKNKEQMNLFTQE